MMFRLDINRLVFISQLYLLLPFLVFILSFFSWFFSFPVAALLLYAFYKSQTQGGQDFLSFSKRDSFLFLSLITFLCLLAFPQTWLGYANDSVKHRAILADLVHHDWPVMYSADERLVYYLGYYILPALCGKLAASLALPFAFIWTFTGLALSVLFFIHFSRLKLIPALLFFALCSGLDILGLPDMKLFKIDELENSIASFQYSSNITALGWVPQHAISAWLGAGIILAARGNLSSAWIIAPVSFYSVFSGMGATLLLLPMLIIYRKNLRSSVPAFAALITGMALLLSWYSSNRSSMNWSFIHSDELAEYFLFVGAELIIFLPFVWAGDERLLPRSAFTVLLIFLFLIPLLRSPHNNDWCMRASLPLLFVFYCRMSNGAMAFLNCQVKAFRMASLLILSAMAINPLLQMAKGAKALLSVAKEGEHAQVRDIPAREAVKSLPDPKLYLGE